MNILQLKGPDVYYTYNPACSYKILSGTVVLFAVRIENGVTGRRMFICELPEGTAFPSMYINNSYIGEWTFLITGLGDVTVEELPECTDECIMEFAKRIELKIFAPGQFAEEIVERVNMRLISEEGFIYAVYQEQKKTHQKSLQLIYQFFKRAGRKVEISSTDNLLYDTVKFLCDYERMDIIPFDTLKETCGRRFNIEDISRLSHFIIREVILDETWYKNDSGPLLVWSEDRKHPYACIPRGTNHYTIFDCETGKSRKLTKEIAATISPQAIMLYKPFENKPLKVSDIVRFALSGIKKADVANMLIYALIGTIIGLLMPYLNEKIFDKYIPLDDKTSLIQVCTMILVFSISNLTFTIVKNLAIFRISNSSQIRIQSAVFDRLYNLPSHFFSKYESADLAQRALGVSSVVKMLSENFISTGLAAIFSLLYLFRMHKYSSKLMWMGLLMILINAAVTLTIGIIQIRYEKEITERNSALTSVIYQLLSGISKIRIAGVENRAMLQYLEPYTDLKKVNIKKERLDNLAQNINALMSTAFQAIFYYQMINKNLDISFGAFMAFLSAFGAFSAAMIAVVNAFLSFNVAIPIYKRAGELLETPTEFIEGGIAPAKINGKIEVNNLSFHYGSEDEMVLKDISFQIQPGEYVGIVGSSGCGKSTLLKVLLGFEDPTYGKVYYDDKDIESLDKRELRKKFGVVLQDGQLISGSIFENVAITSNTLSVDRVQEVIRDVGLEQDIKDMPMGLHTVISEGAGTISGGQRQRILIARAIVNKPNVLFFDEATSALDNINQDLICKSLEKLHATRIVIAHRLSTIINCDRILVFDAGRLVEEGTYQELIDAKSYFYELAKRQIV